MHAESAETSKNSNQLPFEGPVHVRRSIAEIKIDFERTGHARALSYFEEIKDRGISDEQLLGVLQSVYEEHGLNLHSKVTYPRALLDTNVQIILRLQQLDAIFAEVDSLLKTATITPEEAKEYLNLVGKVDIQNIYESLIQKSGSIRRIGNPGNQPEIRDSAFPRE